MDSSRYLLKLYVTNMTPKIEDSIGKLRQVICDQDLESQYELKIINILENPQLAEGDRVLATPTLIKELPAPVKRLIGDISNTDKVLVRLDLVDGGN
ncbi:MAG: circadian clock KaiB family protein [Dehalococcoidia bacterium]